MAANSMVTPFPLGAYTGDPDGSSTANEEAYEADYTSFVSTLGTSPQFLDLYVDYTQPISQWVGNARFYAVSDAQSADAKAQTPVIGLPMASTAAGSATPDLQFQAFASGQYDNVLQGIVKAYADEGFKTLVVRPGWEMNLQGPTYAGDSAQSQADWVKAFQHIYTVLHQAAATNGVSIQVMWNPGTTNYSNAEATTSLYPGDTYVDAIGADVYSDAYPYKDSDGAISTYHDWNTGKEDTSVTQFLADPVNRVHYWNNPAANEYSNDSSGGHSQSLASIVQFAEVHDKSLAIPETGAGNFDGGTAVTDDAAFPQWLAQQLSAAKAGGEKIDFVNLWDSNGGGNYEFSDASDNKPLEAASWARYFGAQAAATSVSALTATASSTSAHEGQAMIFTLATTQPVVVLTAGGSPTLALNTGGTASFDALHSTASLLTFTTTVTAGQSTADLRVTGLSLNGASIIDFNGNSLSAVDMSSLPGNDTGIPISTVTPTIALGSGPDTLTLNVVEDAYNGDAQFTMSVDGTQIGGTQTAMALRGAGTSQAFDINGSFGISQHTVAVKFLNDLYVGTSSTDRNLYVTSSTVDGQIIANGSLTELSGGSQQFSFSITPSAPIISGFSPTGMGVSANNSSSSVVTGTAQAATTVTLYDGTMAVGSAVTSASGTWGIVPSVMSPGRHSLTATATNQAGRVSSISAAVKVSTVQTVQMLQPFTSVITGNRDGGVTLAGSSAANSTVTVSDTVGGTTSVLGTATTSSSGAWTFTSHTVVTTTMINSFAVSARDVTGNTGSMAGKFLLASTGADTLTGTTGVSDVFAIMSFKGSELISGFETAATQHGLAHDVIDFSGRGISSFSQLQALISGGPSAVITIGSGKTITLSDVAPSTLTAADFRYS